MKPGKLVGDKSICSNTVAETSEFIIGVHVDQVKVFPANDFCCLVVVENRARPRDDNLSTSVLVCAPENIHVNGQSDE